MVSIISHVSIKRTVCNNFQMTLLNIQYNLKNASRRNKRTVSIKRTVISFSHRTGQNIVSCSIAKHYNHDMIAYS